MRTIQIWIHMINHRLKSSFVPYDITYIHTIKLGLSNVYVYGMSWQLNYIVEGLSLKSRFFCW